MAWWKRSKTAADERHAEENEHAEESDAELEIRVDAQRMLLR